MSFDGCHPSDLTGEDVEHLRPRKVLLGPCQVSHSPVPTHEATTVDFDQWFDLFSDRT